MKPNSVKSRVRPVVALCAIFFRRTELYSTAEEKTACAGYGAICQIVQFANSPGPLDRPGTVEKKQPAINLSRGKGELWKDFFA